MDKATYENFLGLRRRSWKLYYRCEYQMAKLDMLGERWMHFDVPIRWLVAITATGSVVAGFAFWETSPGRIVWGSIAVLAAVGSITHGVLDTPGRIKSLQNELNTFSSLALDAEDLYSRLNASTDINLGEAEEEFQALRKRYNEGKISLKRDYLLTKKIRYRAKASVYAKLGLKKEKS